MSEKPEIKRSIIKEDGKYVFVTQTPDMLRKEYVSKDIFKKNYEELRKLRNQRREELAAVNKRLNSLNIKNDDKLNEFIELANKAAQYNEMKKAEAEHENIFSLLTLYDQQVNDMEKALPELTRKK